MSVDLAPRSRRTEIVMAGLRVTLGALFLTVWASNVDKGSTTQVLGRPPLDRLPAWLRG